MTVEAALVTQSEHWGPNCIWLMTVLSVSPSLVLLLGDRNMLL
jgi:hypothetical protein